MVFFASQARKKKSFTVLILRPSKYDDDGYVIRYFRGVLPSNTVSVLSALTRQAFESGRFNRDVETAIVPMDDTVEPIDVAKLARRYTGPNRRAVVALAGVQTNQFPRAADLAQRFKAAGFEVMIGGFHVSGSVALSKTMPPELQALMDKDITVVKGEVEDVWGDLLEDAYRGRLKTFYDIVEKPDITNAPIPLIDRRYQKLFACPFFGTVDAGRGCPYSCTFCTIINVQGRKMRCRSAETIRRQVELNYREHKIDYYFFTDDNFARNKNWEAILDALIDLRENKGIPISFMMQVDTKAYKIPRFAEKAARAGCTQVFLGVESLNEENLKAVSKNQNSADDMKKMVRVWHEAGVVCHAGYIIGFPFDTPESVASDIEKLKDTEMDQASFFMLTPLPGSVDHARMAESGQYLDPDYNHYDSLHETLELPGFKKGEWLKAYHDAWNSFYNFEHMRNVLRRCNEHTYWGMFKNFMWYRNSVLEGAHPMLAGFWRLKPRADRRPGCQVEGRLRHFVRRVRESWQRAKTMFTLFFELQELWLQTRIRPEPAPGRLASLRDQIGKSTAQWGKALGTRATDVKNAMGQRGANVVDWIQSNVSEIRQTIAVLGANAREWMQDSASEIRNSIGERGARSFDWIQSNASEIGQAIGVLGANALEWIHLSGTGLSNRFRAGIDYVHDRRATFHGGALVRSFSRALVKWNARGKRRFITSRTSLDAYWRNLRAWVREGRLLRLSLETPRIGVNLLRDARLAATFLVYFRNELTCD